MSVDEAQIMPLTGSNVVVRPIRPDDYGWVFDAAMLTPAGFRWRMHGEVPVFDYFVRRLLDPAKLTCILEQRDTHQPFGVVQLLDHEPLNQTGHLSVFVLPSHELKGWPIEGVFLFCDYAFRALNLRKIYLESLETEAATYRSMVGGLLQEEGVLREHRYVMGEFVDAHIYALYRRDFEEIADVVRRRMVAPAAGEP